MFSFAVHSYNEAVHLERLITSVLNLYKSKNSKDYFNELVILDHRSNDNTKEVCESFIKTNETDLSIKYFVEERDFGGEDLFTFSDLRQKCVDLTSNNYVILLDADFILTPYFYNLLTTAHNSFINDSNVYSIGYEIPEIVESLIIKDKKIYDYGKYKIHPPVPRILDKSKGKYSQRHCGGLFEWYYPNSKKYKLNFYAISGHRYPVLSNNIKTEEREILRRTMNLFSQKVFNDKDTSNWLEIHENLTPREKVDVNYISDDSLKGKLVLIESLEIKNMEN